MKPALPKPEYPNVTGADRHRIISLYQAFADRNSTVWNTAYGELHALQTKKPNKRFPQVFERVWQTYDLSTRAVLFLTAGENGKLQRSALLAAQNDCHGLTLTGINSYRSRFTDSMFNYHCDLPMTVGEIYPLRTPTVAGAVVECVLNGFAYYFESSSRGREYCTLHDGQFRLLETTDYDEQLPYDWDGKCQYIY